MGRIHTYFMLVILSGERMGFWWDSKGVLIMSLLFYFLKKKSVANTTKG